MQPRASLFDLLLPMGVETNPPAPLLHPATLSLFSGAGGLDIGFHRAGFKIVAYVELDEVCCKTLALNRSRYLPPDCQIINRDIREVRPTDIRAQQIDFIIGGPPCQSFSAIARRVGGGDGYEDPRGDLFTSYCRLVEHYQPRGFLFENVRGILGTNRGRDWQLVLAAFAHIGYQLSYKVLDTAEYGVPQHRERVILIGTRQGTVRFPSPTHGPDSPTGQQYVSAIQAITNLQPPNEPLHQLGGKHGHLLAEVPPGRNYSYFTKEMGHPQPVFAWRSRFSDFLYKADPDQPVRTVVAQLGAYSGPFHWKNRRFTAAEFKRLQSFPDDYELAGGAGAVLHQIGNSVPPLFAERLAESVLNQVFAVPNNISLAEPTSTPAFDRRKSRKAQATRREHLEFAAQAAQSPARPLPDQQADGCTETWWHYPTLRHRTPTTDSTPANGAVYRFTSERDGSCCTIQVVRLDTQEVPKPVLRYTLKFHSAVGDGLEQIVCVLRSMAGDDIAVAWDAIEDYLASHSGYRAMMDVYGHFTEPHPSFTLKLDVLTAQPSFPLRFAQRFGVSPLPAAVLPAAELADLYAAEGDKPFDLSAVAHYLRSLRFDVRVRETNTTIPLGYFRCCYPFTTNIDKQVSVSWKGEQKNMAERSQYVAVLTQAYDVAQALVDSTEPQAAINEYISKHPALNHPLKKLEAGVIMLSGMNVAAGVATIMANLKASKYIFSILLTGLVQKIVVPQQDIRKIQADMEGGYSNRNTDQQNITPFLKEHGLTHSAASGMESGRNLERPFPHDLSFIGKTRGTGSLAAYKGILHAVQEEGVAPLPIIVVLLALDLQSKAKLSYDHVPLQGLTIKQIHDLVMEHYQQAKGNGRARLPELAVYAIYQCLVQQLPRYQDASLQPLGRHTGNDKKGRIGDVQVDRLDGTPFEAVEVKSDQLITTAMVDKLVQELQPARFGGRAVDRYYILSTREQYMAAESRSTVEAKVGAVEQQTGCQIVVNGLSRSILYYLRLIVEPDEFLRNYTALVEQDLDVRAEHHQLWVTILSDFQLGRG